MADPYEVNVHGFLEEVKGLQNMLDTYVSSRRRASGTDDELYARALNVFGQNSFSDVFFIPVGEDDWDGISEANDLLVAVKETVDSRGFLGWLFDVIWSADSSLRQTAEEHPDQLEQVAQYLVQVCRMAAFVLLKWMKNSFQATQLALLFLLGNYDQALNIILPYAQVNFDAESVDQLTQENDAKLFDEITQGSGNASDAENKIDDDATSAVEGNAEGITDELSSSTNVAGEVLYRSAALQYVFDADHVLSAAEHFMDVTRRTLRIKEVQEPEFPWDDRDFVLGKLSSLLGVPEEAVSLDEDTLEVLSLYKLYASEVGILYIPLTVVAASKGEIENLMGTQNIDAGRDSPSDYFEQIMTVRELFSNFSAMVLGRIQDPDVTRKLGTSLLQCDLESYVSVVDDLEKEQSESGDEQDSENGGIKHE